MTKVELFNTASRAIHKVGFMLKKHSPEILVVGGVVGTIVAGVMACKATTKVSGILEESKSNIDAIHRVHEDPTLQELYKKEHGEEFTDTEMKKQLAVTYAKTGFELAKTYAPAVTVGALSITSILAGNNILRKRAVAFAAAYASVDNSFKEYRERVVDRFGKELDRELRYNIKAKEIEEVVKNDDGSETVTTKTVQVMEPSARDEFTRCFDETCSLWCRNAEYNLGTIMMQQNYLNEKLKEDGFLSLNEAYEALGFQKTSIGQVVGWVYDEKNPDLQNHIDLGVHDLHDEQKRNFVNGYEQSIWLNFNVDGNLLELMA